MSTHQKVDMRIDGTAGIRFGDEASRDAWLRRCDDMRTRMNNGEYRVAPASNVVTRTRGVVGEGELITVDDMPDPRRAEGAVADLVLKGYVITA